MYSSYSQPPELPGHWKGINIVLIGILICICVIVGTFVMLIDPDTPQEWGSSKEKVQDCVTLLGDDWTTWPEQTNLRRLFNQPPPKCSNEKYILKIYPEWRDELLGPGGSQ